MGIKRYELDNCWGIPTVEEHADGEYVFYRDVLLLSEELQAALREIVELARHLQHPYAARIEEIAKRFTE